MKGDELNVLGSEQVSLESIEKVKNPNTPNTSDKTQLPVQVHI